MKKEFQKLPSLRDIEKNILMSPNPFDRPEIQDFLAELNANQNQNAEYAEVLSELNKLSEKISSLRKKAGELRIQLREIYELSAAQVSPVKENNQLYEQLTAEINALEAELKRTPEDGDKADEIIRQALQLLIKGKSYKRSRIDADSYKNMQIYRKSGTEYVYMRIKGEYERLCNSSNSVIDASEDILQESRLAFIKKQGLRLEDFPDLLVDPSERKHIVKLENKLEFGTDSEIEAVAPYNKMPLEKFIEEIKNEEIKPEAPSVKATAENTAQPKVKSRKEVPEAPVDLTQSYAHEPKNEIKPEIPKAPVDMTKVRAKEVKPSEQKNFQQDFLLTTIPKQNLRTKSSKKRSRK
ncbi:hypothetical protein [Lactovum odontotermitis]